MRTVVAPRSRAAAATRAYSLSCWSSERSAFGCSLISARSWAPGSTVRAPGAGSGDDTRLPADEHAVDPEVVVEHDDVGRPARVEAPDRRDPDDAGRHRARCLERLRERNAERVEVPHRLDHRQHAPGEDAVRPADDAVPERHLEAAEAVRAVAHAGPGARERIRDEREAPGRGAPDDARRPG